MRSQFRPVVAALSLVIATFATVVVAQEPVAKKGKTPIIIIPGITGSELVNKTTGQTAWFRRSRPDDDDVRLPMSANLARNRDDLIAGDIIREVRISRILPEIEIYEKLIQSLQSPRGGYREVNWLTATKADTEDT
ncbi:MAG TPA: hypothetical protein VFZ49_10280, partial [Pyrinomonadaceae bacterium]